MKASHKKLGNIFLSLLLIFSMTINTVGINAEEPVVEEEEVTEVANEEEEALAKESSEEESKEVLEVTEEVSLEETVEVSYPEFFEEIEVEGVKVSVEAPEGVFPEGSSLSVSKVTLQKEEEVNNALEEVRDGNSNVVASYTFDIKVLDSEGNIIQPNDKVKVSFVLAEAKNDNLETQVYHVASEGEINPELIESLEVKTEGEAVVVEAEGFSYYTVEFTYNNLEYVLDGNESVELNVVLEKLGLSGEVNSVEVSNPELFTVENNDGVWTIYSHAAFSSEEFMKVTIDGIEYEIIVTDEQAPASITSQKDLTNGSILEGNTSVTGNGVIMGPGSGSATIKNGTITDSSSNGRKGGVSSVNGSVIIAKTNATLNIENETIKTTNKNLLLNLWSNATANVKGSTLESYGNVPFILVGSDSAPATLNFNGNNTIQNTKGSIYSFVNTTVNVNGTLVLDASDITIDRVNLQVNSGATLVLKGDTVVSKFNNGKITVKEGATVDISESNKYTLNDFPFAIELEKNANVKVKTPYEVAHLNVFNGETVTVNPDGSMVTDANLLDKQYTDIRGTNVRIKADKFKLKNDASIYVYGGAICDVSKTEYTIDDIPKNIYLNNNCILKLATYEVDEVIVNNGEVATIDRDGNVTKEPANYGNLRVVINGNGVYIEAVNYTVKENAPITVNNGGKLYFDNVTMADRDNITINSGGSAYLSGNNTFTNTTIKNTGKIYVDGDAAGIINSSLTLVGEGQTVVENGKTLLIDPTTLTPTNKQQILVEAGGTLTIEDTTVDLSNNGAIRWIRLADGATLNLKNCIFSNSTSLGIIRAAGNNTINIENCTFENNTANGQDPQDKGGVLLVEGKSNVTIKGSTFKNNKASNAGGAIYQVGGGTLNITNTTFENNNANYGGAVYTSGVDVVVDGNSSELKDNTANSANGGAIYQRDGSITVGDGVSFKNNKAERGYGGAIYSIGDVTVGAATFEDNKAIQGGAIFATSADKVDIGAATFKNNTATAGYEGGGAISVATDSGTPKGASELVVNGATFEGNTASRGGAIRVVDTQNTTITGNTTFKNNTAEHNDRPGDGGAIYHRKGVLTIDEATFEENKATGYGGAINTEGAETFIAKNVAFNKNESIQGGAINISSTGAALIEASTFDENKAVDRYGQGGAMHVSRTNMEIYGSKFNNNEATIYGGAITLGAKSNGANLVVGDLNGEPSEFIGNKVTSAGDFAGGGICIHEGSTVRMKKVAIYDNEADDAGAGIANCQIGNTKVHIFEGAAIFDNKVTKGDKFPEAKDHQDVYFFRPADVDYSHELYERMFNGGLHQWNTTEIVTFENSYGDNGPAIIGQSNPTDKNIDGASVIFTKNIATSEDNETGVTSGGAISCNGTLIIGSLSELKLVKIWDDSKDARAYRPTAEEFIEKIQIFANDEELDKAELAIDVIEDADEVMQNSNVVTPDNKQVKDLLNRDEEAWVIVISGLELRDDNDELIKYTVKEGEIEHYLGGKVLGDQNSGYSVKNDVTDTFNIKKVDENGDPVADAEFEVYGKPVLDVVEGEKVDITVTKVWDMLDVDIYEVPETIKISLLADGEEVASTDLYGFRTVWTYVFKNMPTHNEEGKAIVYTVKEIDAVEGFDTYYAGNAKDGFVIVNSAYDIYDISPVIPGLYVNDLRIYVELKNGDAVDNLWANPAGMGARFVYDENGNVASILIPKKASIGGVTYDLSLGAIKNYNDADYDNEKAPSEMQVPYKHTKSTFENEMTEVTFEESPNKYILTYPDFTKATYTSKSEAEAKMNEWKLLATQKSDDNGEINLEGWRVDGELKLVEVRIPDGFEVENVETLTNTKDKEVTITNTLVKTNIEVTKTWNDDDNRDGIRPENITVTLLADGKEVGTKEIKADENGNWKAVFENLPAYKNVGGYAENINYTVKEAEVGSYEVEVVNGFEIINTHIPEVRKITVTKVWDDADNADQIRPEKIVVKLFADGEEIITVDLTEDDNWTHTFEDLPRYNNGKLIEYVVDEEEVEGYTKVVDGYTITNSHDANKEFSVFKRSELKYGIYNAKLQIEDEEGNVVDSWTTDATNHEMKIIPGTYRLSEVEPPFGYEAIIDVTFSIGSDGSITILDGEASIEDNVLVVVDDRNLKDAKQFAIAKLNEDFEELAGATIQILDHDNHNILEEWVSEEEPHVLSLLPGTYIFHEVSAPEGYLTIADFAFEVDNNGRVTLVDSNEQVTIGGMRMNVVNKLEVPKEPEKPEEPRRVEPRRPVVHTSSK